MLDMHTHKNMAITIICLHKDDIVPSLADLKADFMLVFVFFIGNTFKNITFTSF